MNARAQWIGAGAMVVLAAAALRAAPVNDHFLSRLRLAGTSGEVRGTNDGATKEPREPDHGGDEGGGSVWYAWTAPRNGTVTFHLGGSTFDTLLAAYTGTTILSLELVAQDDDGGEDVTSEIHFAAVSGREYEIAVDGFDGESGGIVLYWLLSDPCQAPAPPATPSPADGAAEVPLGGNLSWGGVQALRRRVTYGNDDRQEIFDVANPAIAALHESTVALVSRVDLRANQDGTFTLPDTTYGEAQDLCAGERFADQPNPALCSGFLVGPDLVATAGHCVETAADCADMAFIFGFKMLSAATPALTFPASQIYFCRGIVAARTDDEGADWAIVKLDRKVPDHRSLRIRRTGMIPNGQPIFTIGHPAGLPAKVAGGARVNDNTPGPHFVANLDVYSGNSGSAVFNASTLEVEGIVVRGEEDYELTGGCFVSKRCPDSGCSGEDVTRSTEFQHAVPANPDLVTYEVHLGPCGDMAFLGETADRTWPMPALDAGETYCWQVAVKGECGRTLGPVWSFTTARPPGPVFRRGDPSEDGRADISDPILALFHMFLGAAVRCPKSADANDNGILEVADAVRLLEYLFLDGPPPAEPFAACGQDATPDPLGCEGFGPCR